MQQQANEEADPKRREIDAIDSNRAIRGVGHSELDFMNLTGPRAGINSGHSVVSVRYPRLL